MTSSITPVKTSCENHGTALRPNVPGLLISKRAEDCDVEGREQR